MYQPSTIESVSRTGSSAAWGSYTLHMPSAIGLGFFLEQLRSYLKLEKLHKHSGSWKIFKFAFSVHKSQRHAFVKRSNQQLAQNQGCRHTTTYDPKKKSPDQARNKPKKVYWADLLVGLPWTKPTARTRNENVCFLSSPPATTTRLRRSQNFWSRPAPTSPFGVAGSIQPEHPFG
jgi:hypothetical protein